MVELFFLEPENPSNSSKFTDLTMANMFDKPRATTIWFRFQSQALSVAASRAAFRQLVKCEQVACRA